MTERKEPTAAGSINMNLARCGLCHLLQASLRRFEATARHLRGLK